MAFWDDLINNITGGGNKPAPKAAPSPLKRNAKPVTPTAQRSSTPNKFAPVVEPVMSGGGGGGVGGGMRGFSVPTQVEQPEIDEIDFTLPTGVIAPRGSALEVAEGSKPEPAPDFWGELGKFFSSSVQPDGGIQTIRDAAKPVSSGDSFIDQMGQGQINQGVAAAEKGNDILAWLGEEVHSPGEFFQPVQGSAARTEQARLDQAENERIDGLNNSFGSAGQREVRELTPDEWASLTPDQQQGVISSWALYQASLDDQQYADEVGKEDYNAEVSAIFGDRGTDKYAPNTLRVLQELGYTADGVDADAFIDGGAIPTYEDILGQSTGTTADARRGIYESLAGSTLFDSEGITSSLANGQGLLDTLRNAGNISTDFKKYGGVMSNYGDLGDEDFDYLNTILKNLAYKPVFERIGTDAELNDRLTQSINEANSTYGPEIVTQYFLDSVRGFEDPTFMNVDEFRANWLGG